VTSARSMRRRFKMLKGVDTLTIYLFSTRRKSGDEYQKSRVVVWELGARFFSGKRERFL